MSEILNLKRRVRLLTAALSYARSAFHGSASALSAIIDGEGELNVTGAYESMQTGNSLCSEVLDRGEYMDNATVERILRARISRAKRSATVARRRG